MLLLQPPIAAWKFDEASGTRLDAVGTVNLTAHGTVPRGDGKIGHSADFVAVDPGVGVGNYLQASGGGSVAWSGGPLWISVWARMTTKALLTFSIFKAIVTKYDSDTGPVEWALGYRPEADRYEWVVSGTPLNQWPASPELNTWTYLSAWFDPTVGPHGTSYLSVNGGTPQAEAATTGLVLSTGASLRVGGMYSGSPTYVSQFWDGQIDALHIFNYVPTLDEVALMAVREWPNFYGIGRGRAVLPARADVARASASRSAFTTPDVEPLLYVHHDADPTNEPIFTEVLS